MTFCFFDGWTQSWNAENQLVLAVKGTDTLEFAYDYMGRRVEKKVYSGAGLTSHTRFVYDGYKLIEELDALNSNASLRRYTWQSEEVGLDVPLTVYDVASTATYFYHTDANKNVTELTDASGNVVAHYEYSPFGKVVASSGSYSAMNPFRFSSEYHDDETGLVYYNYRYYSPDLGRWLSRDPIEELGGFNLYNHTGNSPLNHTDKNGEIWPWVALGGLCVGAYFWLRNEYNKKHPPEPETPSGDGIEVESNNDPCPNSNSGGSSNSTLSDVLGNISDFGDMTEQLTGNKPLEAEIAKRMKEGMSYKEALENLKTAQGMLKNERNYDPIMGDFKGGGMTTILNGLGWGGTPGNGKKDK